jgi:hypothetical protein
MRNKMRKIIWGVVLLVAWEAHTMDVGRAKREQLIRDMNEEGGTASFQVAAGGLLSNHLVLITYPPPGSAECDLALDDILREKDNQGARDDLKRVGFSAVQCGDITERLL